jgi:hypothetical protein
MEREHESPDCPLPHQTGVTERSIRGDDRFGGYRIIHDVVVRHFANWVRSRNSAQPDRDDHVVFIDSSLLARLELRLPYTGMAAKIETSAMQQIAIQGPICLKNRAAANSVEP